MTVTTRHPESRFGVPVVLNDDGQVMDSRLSLQFFRRFHGLSVREFGEMCNATTTQVASWEYGRTKIPTHVFNVMRDYLEDEKNAVMASQSNGKFNQLKKRLLRAED